MQHGKKKKLDLKAINKRLDAQTAPARATVDRARQDGTAFMSQKNSDGTRVLRKSRRKKK